MSKAKTKMSVQSSASPKVLMEAEVARRIRQHGRSSMKTEICGVLIGNDLGAETIVEACIPGANAAQGGAHVTFTQDTWEHIYQVKDKEYPEARIVGWYHSHPGFGVFLSDHDLFIHENFFSSPKQIAWVYDPHTDEEGCFGWKNGEIKKIDDVAMTYGQTCGESIVVDVDDEEEVVKIAAPEKSFEWSTVFRDALVYFALVAATVGATMFMIERKAHLIPRDGTGLFFVDHDSVILIPPEIAARILSQLQSEIDRASGMQQQLPPGLTQPANPATGGTNSNRGEQNGRK